LEGNVVNWDFGKKVVEKPEPLLCKREPKGVRTFYWEQRDRSAKSLGIFYQMEKFILIPPNFCEEIICDSTFGSSIPELVVFRP
jgi:hypothetical protein